MKNKQEVDFYQCIKAHVQMHTNQRVSTFEWQGHKIWIKQAEKVKYSIWLRFAKGLSKLIKAPLMRPTLEIDGLKALRVEAKRLSIFFAQGIFVPQILAKGTNWIAMSDTGKTVSDSLQNKKISQEEKMHILRTTSKELAEMHRKKLYHGRPALKDFTWDGEKVSFLDLEENAENVLTLEQCMTRDVLIYIHSLFREVKSVRLIYTAILEYRKYAPKVIWQYALQEAAHLKFLYFLLKYTYPCLGIDAKEIYHTLHALHCMILMEKKETAELF